MNHFLCCVSFVSFLTGSLSYPQKVSWKAADLDDKLTLTWQLILLYTILSEKTLRGWLHTLIIHYHLHSSCPPVVQCCRIAIPSQEDRQGKGRRGAHISLKWRSASNRASLFSSLLARVPFHCPGMQSCWNVGTRVWYGGWVCGSRLARNKKGGWRQRCDQVMAPQSRDRRWGIQCFQPNTCEPDIEPLGQAWPEVHQSGLDYCSCCYELSI